MGLAMTQGGGGLKSKGRVQARVGRLGGQRRARRALGCVALVAALAACGNTGDGGEEGGAPSTGAAATTAPAEQSATSTGTSGAQGPETSAEATGDVPPYEGREGAVQLGVEFREAAEAGGLKAWLTPRAVYPFDVDGKVVVKSAAELDEALAREVGDVAAQVKPHTTCVAITREEVLKGAPWHYLDRLGERPPREELERDLTRLGVTGADWWVNCHKEGSAGYALIVTTSGKQGPARIRAFRN